MFSVQLTHAEVITCRIIGNTRALAARSANVVDKRMSDQSGIHLDEDGVIGEFAFCKHKNIFFDPSASPRSGSFDCLLLDKRLDIKTTRYANGRLIATMKKNPDVDVFVLAIYDAKTHRVTFPGYVLADQLYRPENVRDLGHGPGYAIEQKNLNRWQINGPAHEHSAYLHALQQKQREVHA